MSKATNAFIFIGGEALALSIDNKAYNVDSTHQNWDEIVSAVRANNLEIIPNLINQAKAVSEFVLNTTTVEGFQVITVDVENGTIEYAGQPVNNVIVEHIFNMMDQGFSVDPMLRFLDNLLQNPRKKAVDELYGFMQFGKMPITEDGCFLAYKRVRGDYLSIHDGKTDNSIGNTVAMPRNMVDDDPNSECSTGLHFCSHAYLSSFGTNVDGNKVVILKVNPRDVVSIPRDYNNTKGRACQYDVIGELTPEEAKKALSGNIFVDAVHNGVTPADKFNAFDEFDEFDEELEDDLPLSQALIDGLNSINDFMEALDNAANRDEEDNLTDQINAYINNAGVITCSDDRDIFSNMVAQVFGDLLCPELDDEQDALDNVADGGVTINGVCYGNGAFFMGYEAGYNDRDAGNQYYRSYNDLELSPVDIELYEQGYNEGWVDGENDPRAYVFSA